MPTIISETDTFPATIQRPSNGELADSASLAQFADALAKRTRYAYNRSLPGNFDASRAPYSAVGSGAVNDYPAIAAAAADAVSAGGGTVWLTPGKSYRLDTELVLDGRVDLRTKKGYNGTQQTRLLRNHAGRLVKISNAIGVSNTTPTIIEGFECRDLAASSQPMIDMDNGSLTLLRCWLHGINGVTNGPLVKSQGGEGEVLRLRECWVAPDTGGIGIEHNIGLLDASGNVFAFPATYSSAMIYVNSTSSFDPAVATILGNDFWAKQVTSGSPLAIALDGLLWKALVAGNHFRGAAAHPLDEISWGSGGVRQLNVGPNTHEQSRRYVAAGAALFNDSSLDLGTWRGAASSGTYALPDGYGNMILVSTDTSGTDVVFPQGLVEGQPLTFTYVNDTVNTVAIALLTTPVTGTALPGAIAAGETLTGTFAWEKAAGSGIFASGRWIQKGTWGIGVTLA